MIVVAPTAGEDETVQPAGVWLDPWDWSPVNDKLSAIFNSAYDLTCTCGCGEKVTRRFYGIMAGDRYRCMGAPAYA
ncbi:MAG: hypothetical protein ACYS7Y_28705 [Planctomycetota bacterium]|jgi:hypothetical protein